MEVKQEVDISYHFKLDHTEAKLLALFLGAALKRTGKDEVKGPIAMVLSDMYDGVRDTIVKEAVDK